MQLVLFIRIPSMYEVITQDSCEYSASDGGVRWALSEGPTVSAGMVVFCGTLL